MYLKAPIERNMKSPENNIGNMKLVNKKTIMFIIDVIIVIN